MTGVPGVRLTKNDCHHHPFFWQLTDRHFRATTGRLDSGLERQLRLQVGRLTARDEQRQLVKTGRYMDDHAVLSRSLKLLQEYESKMSHLRAEIQRGKDSGEHSPFDVEDTIKQARERLEQRTTTSTQLHRI